MAGFVKLHSSMLRSTIWFARPDRELFITALLMAEPREFTVPVAQLKARSLDETGWQIPPGWYGFCEASGPGIIHVAGVPEEDGFAALDRLGSPEPESRSQAFEGRRLVRVDGGWVALNYDRYREKDTTCSERAARYRARKAEEKSRRDVTVVTRDVTPVTRDVTLQDRSVTQAEAEAEAEAEDRSGIGEREHEPAQTAVRSTTRAKRSTKPKSVSVPCPESIEPTEATLAVATEVGRSWLQDFAAMRDWALAKGERKVDWQAALRSWMRRSIGTPQSRPSGGHRPPQPNDLANPYKPRIFGEP